jgi:signal transduction histidine kinase
MNLFSSLTNRIFVAAAALAVLAIAVAAYSVNVAVTAQAENELQRGLHEAGALLEENRSSLFTHFTREARLIADLPRLKAALSTKDPQTVQPIVDDYYQLLGSDLIVLTDPGGRILGQAGRQPFAAGDSTSADAIRRATTGHEVVSLWPHPTGVVQVVSVPSFIESELIGTVSLGFGLDQEAAARFKALTNSEVAFAVGNRIQVSTLPATFNDALLGLVGAANPTRIWLDDVEYVGVSRSLPLVPVSSGAPGLQISQATATAIILRSRTDRLRFLSDVHRELAYTALLALLAATLLSYGIARTVTRPLGAITATMREMAATGDLTRRIAQPSGGRWEDEDAQLLASTFNVMTDSIARFQREAAQRERLSSLGRLSTVVAHEIRNPLMIIKTALRGLRGPTVSPEDVRTAVADIDEEIARLNRIVTEVLDFARPIKFDLARTDLNELCRDAARAISSDPNAVPVTLDLDPGIPEIDTDAERLRLALVNILTNARHAVAARNDPPPSQPIRVRTHQSAFGRVAIEVRDRGVGISPEELPRVFDPFFTTRRTGTGLGLAISRNIIEGLGGTITVSSKPGEGTAVDIDLPATSVEPARVPGGYTAARA